MFQSVSCVASKSQIRWSLGGHLTLKVANASDAMSKVETSTYLKKSKKLSELRRILVSASYRMHSRSIAPQFNATSCCSYLKTRKFATSAS